MTTGRLFDELPDDEKKAFLRLFHQAAAGHGWQTEPEELLDRWKQVIDQCRSDYSAGLDDYTNDLSVREIVQEILDADRSKTLISLRSIVADLDDRFRGSTIELQQPIFAPSRVGRAQDRLFFYFRIPSSPGSEMTQDLIRMRLLDTPEDSPAGR
jgi:hypothetical protein